MQVIPNRNCDEIKYHVNICYPCYVRSSERFEKKTEIAQIEDLIDELGPSTSFTQNRPIRRSVSDVSFTLPSEKPFIICNQMKSRGDTKILRISEVRRASLFLSAIKFNKDEVFTQCILLGSSGDIFVADVMYHKNCLSNYLRKFEREVEMIMNPPLDYAENVEITKILQELSTVRTINIKNHAYCLSDCRDSVNEVLNRQRVNGNYFFYQPTAHRDVRFKGLFDVATLQNTFQEDPKRNRFLPLTKETSKVRFPF